MYFSLPFQAYKINCNSFLKSKIIKISLPNALFHLSKYFYFSIYLYTYMYTHMCICIYSLCISRRANDFDFNICGSDGATCLTLRTRRCIVIVIAGCRSPCSLSGVRVISELFKLRNPHSIFQARTHSPFVPPSAIFRET